MSIADQLADAHKRNEWDTCVDIIDESWLPLLTDDLERLSRTVFELPPDVRRSSPIVWHLAELCGVEPIGEVLVDVPTHPDDVEALAKSTEVRALLGAATLAMVARRILGHNAAARSLALALAEVIGRTSLVAVADASTSTPGNNVTDLKTYLAVQAGLAGQYADDRALALRMFTEAWRERDHDCTGHAARAAAMRLAVEASLSGEAAEARRWLQCAEREPHGRGQVAAWTDSGVSLAEFVLALDSLDRDAMAQASRVADLPEREEQWPFVTWAAARYALLRSEPERALTLIGHAREQYPRTSRGGGVHGGLLAMGEAEAELALGRGNRALAALAAAPPTSYFGRITEARTFLLAGDDERASSIAHETAQSEGLTRRARLEALLIRATAALRLGERDAASHAQRAAAMIDTGGPASALLGVPRSALCQLATEVSDAAPLAARRDELAVADLYPESIDLVQLTESESVVLDHLTAGSKRASIAAALYVSENTVKSHLRTLYAKLDVTSRDAAIARAQELGLLSGD